MTEWRDATVAELCAQVDYGYTASASDDPELPRFLRITDIVGSHIDWRSVPGCEVDQSRLNKFLLAEGDIVVARTGATVGHAKRIRQHPEAVFASYLVRFRPAEGIEPSFLGAVVESAAYKEWVLQHAGGAAQPNANAKVLGAFPLRVPDTAAQRRIGSILDSVDDLIGNNRRRVEVLEEMARAIYREWFVRFRYPGHEDVPLVDSPLGPIPGGWTVSTCGDELTALGGGTPSKKEPAFWDGGTIPWFTPSDLTKSKQRYAGEPELTITSEGLARSSARLFPKGSVLMTSRATLGVLAIATVDATTNQGFIVIPPDARWSPSFIYEWLDFHAEALTAVATGATFKEITKGAFKRVPFLVPAQDVLGKHREFVDPVESQIRVLEEQTRALGHLRDLLLPKLVTGQIDVSQLDLDVLTEAATA